MVEFEGGFARVVLELEANYSIGLGSVEEAVVPDQEAWLTIEMESQAVVLVVVLAVAEPLQVVYRNFV